MIAKLGKFSLNICILLLLRLFEMLFHVIEFMKILTHSSNTPLGEKGFAVQLFSSGIIPWHCLNLHSKFPCSAASPLEKKEDPPWKKIRSSNLPQHPLWERIPSSLLQAEKPDSSCCTSLPTSLEFHSEKSPSSSLRARLFQALQPSTFLSLKWNS